MNRDDRHCGLIYESVYAYNLITKAVKIFTNEAYSLEIRREHTYYIFTTTHIKYVPVKVLE